MFSQFLADRAYDPAANGRRAQSPAGKHFLAVCDDLFILGGRGCLYMSEYMLVARADRGKFGTGAGNPLFTASSFRYIANAKPLENIRCGSAFDCFASHEKPFEPVVKSRFTRPATSSRRTGTVAEFPDIFECVSSFLLSRRQECLNFKQSKKCGADSQSNVIQFLWGRPTVGARLPAALFGCR